MFKKLFQLMAFFFPPPLNHWMHRLAGAKIHKHAFVHPCVLILADEIEIGPEAKIRFGTFINVRKFKIGQKSRIGYFVIVKGLTDFLVDAACVVGPKTMVNCDCPVTMNYYTGVGPNCTLFTHGSFLPVTEGFRTSFGPIELKSKAWITMNSTIGPGVTIGEGSNIMPGTVLVESIGQNRLVAGNPAKLTNIPMFRNLGKAKDLEAFALQILQDYCQWSNQYQETDWHVREDVLEGTYKKKRFLISMHDSSDITLVVNGDATADGMYFNIKDLATDKHSHPMKESFEEFMRLYYGMTFLYKE